MKIFTYGIIGIVAVAVIAGFFIVGSPAIERVRRFDERRITDLSSLQGEIAYFWQSKQKLPAALGELRDDLRGVVVPVDPETGMPYEYRITGAESFELCSVFSLPSDLQEYKLPARTVPVPAPETGAVTSWDHGAGRTCFSRNIDKDFFPPIKK